MAQFDKYGTSQQAAMVVMAKNAVGEYGKEVLSGTNLTTSRGTFFRQILVIEDALFDTINDDESLITVIGEGEEPEVIDTMNTLIGGDQVTIKAGTMIYGLFHDIELTSGTVICYKEAPSNMGVKLGGSSS